jgi:hypothetical protein
MFENLQVQSSIETALCKGRSLKIGYQVNSRVIPARITHGQIDGHVSGAVKEVAKPGFTRSRIQNPALAGHCSSGPGHLRNSLLEGVDAAFQELRKPAVCRLIESGHRAPCYH